MSSKPLPPVPASYVELVEAYPTWRSKYKFFVDEDNWPKFKPLYDRLKVYYDGKLGFSMLGHASQQRDGVRFGTDDPEVEPLLFKIFKEPSAPPEPFFVEEPKNKDGRRKYRDPYAAAPNQKYPWERLRNIGDHFLVEGEKSAQKISTITSQRAKRLKDPRIFRVMAVSEGILVVLVEAPEVEYRNVVRKVQ